DDFVDQRDALSRDRFFEAENNKQSAFRELGPLMAALGPMPKERLDTLLALDSRWHALVNAEVWDAAPGAIVRHSAAREDIWDDMLESAAHVDEAITLAGRERIASIGEVEAFQRETTALLGLLARAALAEAMASRARFMRGVSHDLKNPIHAIDGHAQLLEDEVRGPLNDAQRDSVARIRRSARAMLGLI